MRDRRRCRRGLAGYVPAAVLADGTRLFDTATALVAEDVNRKRDVYAWKDGKARLLSSGVDRNDAVYLDVSADGTDVYFATFGRLVSQDIDAGRDIYSARRAGGLAGQNPLPVPAQDCLADACQGLADGVAPGAGGRVAGVCRVGRPPGEPEAAPATVSVSKLRTVSGLSATLRVRVPGAGRISASGPAIGSVKRTADRAATYPVKVSLTARATASLKKHKTLKVRVRVAFAPTSGASASKTVTVTFTLPRTKKSGHRSATGGR